MTKNLRLFLTITIAIIAIIAIVIGIFILQFGLFSKPSEDSYDQNIKILNKYPADIMVYGEDINFRESVNYRRINSLSSADISSNGFDYIFIIINDRNGTANISDQEYENLLYLVKNENYNLFYVGKDKFENFKNKGYFDMLDLGLAGFGYVAGPDRNLVQGDWMESDEIEYAQYNELLGDRMVFFMVDVLTDI